MQTDKEQQWEVASAKARAAIYDTDGRGMIGAGRNYLQDRVARAILASEKEAVAQLEALAGGVPVAWGRVGTICDLDGRAIGSDEPEFAVGAEPPDDDGRGIWFPLFLSPPSREGSPVAQAQARPDGPTEPPVHAGNLIGKPLPEHLRWKGPGPAPASWMVNGVKVYRSYEDYCDD